MSYLQNVYIDTVIIYICTCIDHIHIYIYMILTEFSNEFVSLYENVYRKIPV